MATKVAQKRLQKEYLAMQRAPPPFIWACPEEKNILDWHFIIRGPPGTPYEGGEYHGLIWFPSDYPFKPPDVKLFTPSGRFEVGHKICMSMTSYHPSTWNAAWSVATILTGLLSFMLSDEITAGAVRTSDAEKKEFAKQSHAFNLNNRKFRDIFPTYTTPEMTDLPDMGKQPGSSSTAGLKDVSDPSTPASTMPNSSAATRTGTPAPVDPTNAAGPGGEVERQAEALAERIEGGPAAAQGLQPARPFWAPSWRFIVAVAVFAALSRLVR